MSNNLRSVIVAPPQRAPHSTMVVLAVDETLQLDGPRPRTGRPHHEP
jgi:hypothetical protein